MDAKSNRTAQPLASDAPPIPTQEAAIPNTKKKSSAIIREILLGIITAALGYLAEATVLPFGARPFGIALLCSADRRVFFLYAGLCLSAWQSEQRLLLLVIYSSILIFRAIARLTLDSPYPKAERTVAGEQSIGGFFPHLFSEHLALRVCIAGVAALSLGLWQLLNRDFLFYDLYGTILSITVCALAPLILSGIFTKREVGIYRYVTSILGLSAIVILSLSGWQIWGISLSTAAVMGITLFVTERHGVILGALSGTLLGLLISVELAPAFAFAALASGLLFSLSRFLGLTSAFAVAIAWSAYVEGLAILNGTLTGILCATVLFSVYDRFFLSSPHKEEETICESAYVRTECEPLSSFAIDSIRLYDTKQTIKHLCESFSELSDALFTLSQKMQAPTASDLRQICDKSFDASCASCCERTHCWGEQYHETSAEIGSLCTMLRQNGRIELKDAPPHLIERCGRLPDITDEINHRAAQHQKQLLQNDRTEIFATDYRALSNLLAAAMVMQEEVFSCENELTQTLCKALNECKTDLGIRQVAVCGTRRHCVRVMGKDRDTLLQYTEEIRKQLQDVCPFSLGAGELSKDGSARIDFPEAEQLAVICAQRSICADEESLYCGDTTGLFSTEDGRFCALISDGMGSGREASLTSGLCSVFLKKLILSGSSCDMALDMLNEFLRNRGSSSLHECSSTIDLLSLDLLHKKAYFYKCGAAPTYVFRDGNLFKIRSHTVPLGIIAQPDTRKLELTVSAGDVIIMVSDGVTQSKEECPWLFDLLRSQSPHTSVERLADLIVKYAKGEGCSDDVSVLITKIVEPQNEEIEST